MSHRFYSGFAMRLAWLHEVYISLAPAWCQAGAECAHTLDVFSFAKYFVDFAFIEIMDGCF